MRIVVRRQVSIIHCQDVVCSANEQVQLLISAHVGKLVVLHIVNPYFSWDYSDTSPCSHKIHLCGTFTFRIQVFSLLQILFAGLVNRQ